MANICVFGGVCLGRVLRRHFVVSHGGYQGAHSDFSWSSAHAARLLPYDHEDGGHRRFLQGSAATLGSPDSLHNDEVRLLRANCRGDLPIRGAEAALRMLKPEQLVVTFVAGYIAGIFCAIVSHPADTIVSKLNQEKGATAMGIAKKVGFAGLWKGLTPRIIMIGTLTALQWFIYDGVKVFFNIPRPPPPAMPESLRLKLAAAGKL
jgi:hypothetical protein